MRQAASGLVLAAGLTAGCTTTEYDTSVPLVQEFKTAPAEDARFDQLERDYKKPAPKQKFKPGLGPGGPGGMGASGMAGPPPTAGQ